VHVGPAGRLAGCTSASLRITINSTGLAAEWADTVTSVAQSIKL